jgi:hypothetical protein
LTEESTSGTQQAVEEKAQQAKEQLQQATGSAQDKMRQQVDARSTEAGHQVDSVAEAMRKASEHLSGQGNELPAKAAEQVAQKAEQLGQYLRESDADRILSDVEDFARRQPWIVAAAGLAVGVAAARFLKASSRRRYQQNQRGSDYRDQATATYDSSVYPSPAAAGYEPEPRYSTLEPEARGLPPVPPSRA